MTTPGQPVNSANDVVSNYPWMAQREPALTAEAIKSGDPAVAGTLAATSHVQGTWDAVQKHQDTYNSQSLWASAIGDVKNVLGAVIKTAGKIPAMSTIMNWSNKGMQEMQKDFKFINAVYHDHGVGPGLLATLGVVGGGVAGSFVGPEGSVAGAALGASLGADIMGFGERQLLGTLVPNYKDSYDKSNDPNYIANPGAVVTNFIGKVPGFQSLQDAQHGWGQTVSGAVDIAFDFKTDPLMLLGKIGSITKNGGFVRQATKLGADGKEILDPVTGKPEYLWQKVNGKLQPEITSTMKWAQQSPAVINFLKSSAGVTTDTAGMLDAYRAGKESWVKQIPRLLNPIGSNNAAFARAVDTAVSVKNGFEIQRLFPASGFTELMANELAKAKDASSFIKTLGDVAYSKEIDNLGETVGANSKLTLPTMTLGRARANEWIAKNRQKVGDTSFNEERNLLLPKKVAVKDNDGNILVDEATGKQRSQMLAGGLYSVVDGKWQISNAFAGKIRTYTNYKALTINDKTLVQSGKELKFTNQDAGQAMLSQFLYTMPYKVAVEHVAKILTAKTTAKQVDYYSAAVKEAIKAGGIADYHPFFERVMSQAQRSAKGREGTPGLYGNTVKGGPLGPTEMQPSTNINGKVTKVNDPISVAMVEHQHGTNGIIDYKALRTEIRNANAYNKLYIKGDDYATRYTEKIFAPLVLFTTGFGIRVASNEALHQVMRHGLGQYIQSAVASNARRYNVSEAMIKHMEHKLTESITPEDAKALTDGSDGIVKSNAVTKFLADFDNHIKGLTAAEKELSIKGVLSAAKANVKPFGYVSSKMAPYIAKDKLQVIADFQDLMSGQALPPLASAAHDARYNHAYEDEAHQMIQSVGSPTVPGQNIMGLFGGTEANYHNYLALNLTKDRWELTSQDIAKDFLNLSTKKGWSDLTNDQKWQKVTTLHTKRIEDPTTYSEQRPYSVGMREGVPASFAGNQVERIRGMVEGPDGFINTKSLNNIAKQKITMADDLKKIPISSSPLKVVGKINQPTMSNLLERMTDGGHRLIISPMIDYISREPIFNHYLYENYRNFDSMVEKGLLTRDDALRMAGQNAVKQMIPLIHNPALRSQVAVLHRAALPFYFAQEQAMKRVGRLITNNPQAFRDFQMINQGINNPGFVHTDANGTKYIVYPIMGEWGNAIARAANALGFSQFSGMPTSVTGSMQSLVSVLPELKLPGVGTHVNMLLTNLSQTFPDFYALNRVANVATGANPLDPNSKGFTTNGIIDAIIPNSMMRDIWNGLNANEQENTVHNAILSSMAAAYYHGYLDNYAQMTPSQQMAVLDKIKMNARTNLIVKGLFSFLLPLAPSVSNDVYNKDLQSLRSEFLNLTLPTSQGGKGMKLPEATAHFMAEHGSHAVSYTVARTNSGAGGAYIPLANSSVTWLKDNKDLMASDHAMGAAYLVPQITDGKNALLVEAQLLADHLRGQQTPTQFMDAINIAKGWTDIAPELKAYEAATLESRASGNRHQTSINIAAWNQVTLDYGKSNPIWYADYKNTDRKLNADKALADLQTIRSMGKLGTSVQSKGIADLLDSYADYHGQLEQNKIQGTLRVTPLYSQIKNQWYDYLMQQAIDTPELANVINGVFKRVV